MILARLRKLHFIPIFKASKQEKEFQERVIISSHSLRKGLKVFILASVFLSLTRVSPEKNVCIK